jgi:hypothetical protein
MSASMKRIMQGTAFKKQRECLQYVYFTSGMDVRIMITLESPVLKRDHYEKRKKSLKGD